MTSEPPVPPEKTPGSPPDERSPDLLARPLQTPPPPPSGTHQIEGRSQDPALIRNAYVLAGLAIAISIVLAILVVVTFGNSGGGGLIDVPLVIDGQTPHPGRGVAARSIAIATVREGPGSNYVELGVLRNGQDVEVSGRNTDASWFQIFFPSQSQLRGWVPSSALGVPDTSLGSIPIAAVTPIPRPTVLQPTFAPEPTATVVESPTAISTESPGPDLAIGVLNNNCQTGVPLVVTVENVGEVPVINRQVRITVSTNNGPQGLSDVLIPSLSPGEVVNIPTNQLVVPPRTTAQIDLFGSPLDINPTNDSVDCVGLVELTPTPLVELTPTPDVEPEVNPEASPTD